MSDDKKDHIKKISLAPVEASDISEEILEDLEALEAKDEVIELNKASSVRELSKFGNLKTFITNTVGNHWMLAYRSKEDGSPVFIPSVKLSPEDQVFLAEMAKSLIFSGMMVDELDLD